MATNYITIQDIIETYGEKDLPPKAGVPDIQAGERAILAASNHFDLVLEGAGVDFPLDQDTINKLKEYVMSLARYNYKKRSSQIPQFVIDDSNNALNVLELIRTNDYPLLKNKQTKTGLRSIEIIID